MLDPEIKLDSQPGNVVDISCRPLLQHMSLSQKNKNSSPYHHHLRCYFLTLLLLTLVPITSLVPPSCFSAGLTLFSVTETLVGKVSSAFGNFCFNCNYCNTHIPYTPSAKLGCIFCLQFCYITAVPCKR